MNKKHLLCGAGSLSLLVSLNNIDNVKALENENIYLNKELMINSQGSKTAETIVSIKDKNLLRAINNQLGRGNILDSVTITDMESLTYLNAESKNIIYLDGLEYAVNIKNLRLSSNQIKDISPLSNLRELAELHLGANPITNIEPLSDLIKLKKLYFNHCKVLEDISPLKKLTNLSVLWLYENNISDISVLQNLVNLTDLRVSQNQIKDISSLSNLYNLTVLSLAVNNIEDISYISGLTNLTTLGLARNNISNIDVLSNLKKLTDLSLGDFFGGNKISDISVLSNLHDLTTLNLGANQISDISALENLNNLENLYLHKNKISDIDKLSNLINLKKLHLYHNELTDISIVENLIELDDLRLDFNNITDINILKNLTNLEVLQLSNNQISDISILENLTNLTYLHLSNNQISDISALENLTNLEDLRLSNNQISNISELENLTNLIYLYLNHNQISDISGLENLTNLIYLYLNNNQISDISGLENLINLKDLQLHNNQISDISALENLTNLIYLYLTNNQISDISALENLTSLKDLYLNNNQVSDISVLNNLTNLNVLYLYNNQISNIPILNNLTKLTKLEIYNNKISDISALDNLTNLKVLYLNNNQISDISSIRNLKNLTILNLSNQNPVIEAGDFNSKTDKLDISINNPIFGLNNKVSNLTNLSNNGVHENGRLKWNNVPLGNHVRTFNFSESVTIGSASTTFNGFATLNLNVVDKGEPESDHTSEFDESDFGIYATVTATDLGEGVSHLIHKGVRHALPYRFKYDVYDSSNNIVEVYDLVNNKAEYQVKLKDSDIPTIEEGLDALTAKDNIAKEDVSYFRTMINNLDESSNKDLLQDRLNSLSTTDTLERKTATGNLDVYIKSQNMLSMSLDTNSITFDGYSGTEDMEMLNAVNISINSSLPYSLNAYMPTEITNNDKSETLPINILNIRDESEGAYQTFANNTDKVVLKDNCVKGNNNSHDIDLKLSSNQAHKADVYKTVIKFEAEQK